MPDPADELFDSVMKGGQPVERPAAPVPAPSNDPADLLYRSILTNPTGGHAGWKDEGVPLAARVGDFLSAHLHAGRQTPWEDVAPDLKQRFGVEPDQFRTQYETNAARQRASTMSIPRQYTVASVLPGARLVQDTALDVKYGNAQKRIAEGKGETKDFDFVAQHEKLKDILANEPFADKAQRALMGVPALAAEYMSGARLAAPVLAKLGLRTAAGAAIPAASARTVAPRAAADLAISTAPQPAMYLPRMIENNKEAGRDPTDLRGLPAAYALGMLNTAVLGRAQGRMLQPGSTLGKLPVLGRVGAAGVIGAGEAAGADVVASGLDDIAKLTTGKSLELDTKYGTVGQLIDPKTRAAGLENAAISALTFAAFAGLHAPESRGRLRPDPVMEPFKKLVDAAPTPADAAKSAEVAHAAVKEALKEPAKAPEIVKTIEDPAANEYAEKLVETVVEPTQTKGEATDFIKKKVAEAAKPIGPVEALPPETQADMAKSLGVSVKELVKRQNEPLIAGLAGEAAKPVQKASENTSLKPTSAATVAALPADLPVAAKPEPLPPLPAYKPKTAFEQRNAIRSEAAQASLAKVVKDFGGIDPADPAFLAHYESKKRAIEDGIPASVFKEGGRGLDQIAQELGPHDPTTGLKGGGYVPDANPETVLRMLKEGTPHMHADQGATHGKAMDEYYRRQQEEADSGPREPASESDESGAGGGKEIDLGGGVMFSGVPVPAWVIKGMDKATRMLLGAGRGADPAFRPDADPNPNNPAALPPENIVKQAAANQLGARNTSPMELATTAWAWGKHAAEQIANAWGLMRSTKPDAFTADAKTRDVPLDGGARGFMSDVIEAELRNPGSQPLTAEQRAEVAAWKDIRDKQLKAMDAAGVKFYDDAGNVRPLQELLDGDYFPRTTADKGEFANAWEELFGKPSSGKSSLPGVRPSFRHGREHATEAEGVKAQTEYLPTFNERVRKFIRDSNVEIATARLANDPGLGGVDVKHKAVGAAMARVKDKLKALRDAGEDALADDLERQTVMLAVQGATGNVHVAPAFRGKEYPEESKRWIETMYGEGSSGRISNLIRATLKEMQGLVLSVDFSYLTLQLGKMMWRNPVLFAKTVVHVPQTLFNSKHFAEVVNRTPALAQAMREIPQVGGSLGTPPEQAGAFGQGNSGVGNLFRKLPVVGKPIAGTYEAFGRTFGQVMDLAKLHLWAATKPADQAQWPRHMEAIENSLGQGRMEQLGMTPERAMIERALFLAPSYYRSHLKLLQQMGQGGAPGRFARQQVGFLAGGVMLSSIGMLMAARKAGVITDEEFEERLNPERGKFLMVPVPLGHSGKTAEVGFGGFYVSMVRSLATSLKADNPNPTGTALKQFYRGHAGMGPRTAWDVASGRDYLGKPISPGMAVGRALAPLGVQQSVMAEGTPAQNASDTAAGLVGLRGFPGSEAGQRADSLRKTATAMFGKRYDTLTLPEQAQVVRQFKKDNPEPKPPAAASVVQAAIEAQDVRKQRLTKAVAPETRKLLEEFRHPLPDPDTHVTIRGQEVPLTPDRQKRYEQLLAEEYDKTAGKWDADRLRALKPEARQAVIRSTLEFAKERARGRLLREGK
jgi:hypothetical protein